MTEKYTGYSIEFSPLSDTLLLFHNDEIIETYSCHPRNYEDRVAEVVREWIGTEELLLKKYSNTIQFWRRENY